jgi:23S rRNA (pseudouridine1915-N3)-methyltransferase
VAQVASIRIIAVGKLKEAYFQAAQAEYLKRLKSYLNIDLIEVPDLPCPEGASPALDQQVRLKESAAIQNCLRTREYLVTLDRRGRELDSPALAGILKERTMAGDAVVFAIGGSLGLSAEFLASAPLNLSFSQLTFPHQLFRIMLLEQIYRSVKLNRGEKYHK